MDIRQKDFFAALATPTPALPPAEESAKRSLRLITRSSLAAFRTCARLYLYSYVQRYRSLHVAPALATGTLGHLGLEAWWRAAQAGAHEEARLDAALAAIAHEQDPFERARMGVLLAGYSARWGGEQWEVLDVEVSFEAEIIHPATGAASRTWVQGGKIDVVVRDPADGLIWIVEHKFTGEDFSPGSNYWRRLKTDQQISIYYQGAAALFGHLGEIGGCLYDVVGKPTTRPLKATAHEARKYKKDGTLYANQREVDETPEEYAARLTELVVATPAAYFARGQVVRLEEELVDAQWDIWQTARSLREAELADRWPRNPDACARYGRSCEFLPVCCREATLDDPTLFRRASATHEELAHAVALPAADGSTPKEQEI